MKKITFIFFGILFLFSCAEKLLDEPDNLISKEKMVEILNDLAMLNAAKTTNATVLINNDIEPMQYLYTKHDIDSVQFVESDRYYASIPQEHEEIYTRVTAKLKKEEDRLNAEKNIRDSIKRIERKEALRKTKLKDSLRKIADKKRQ